MPEKILGGESVVGQDVPMQEPPISEKDIETIAETCHEANRVYCRSIGDLSQPAWSDAPDWQKDSAREGVRLTLEHRGLSRDTGEESHNRWLDYKLREGWTWGPVKDPEKKQHPSMLSYRSLTPEVRRKDVLFDAICRALDPRFRR